MLKVGVFISGRGSNLESLVAACAVPGFPAELVCVISNKADAAGLEHARRARIPALVIAHRNFTTREAFEEAIDTACVEHGVQLICLAGFMRILTPWFVDRWRDRLINIHPSLLPAFPGLDTHQKALSYGAKLTGCTIHFVRAEMDHGPIILQAAVPIIADDDEQKLAARVLAAEHKAYPAALRLIADNRVNVYGERTFIADAVSSEELFANPVIDV